jgi:hypothetical protein
MAELSKKIDRVKNYKITSRLRFIDTIIDGDLNKARLGLKNTSFKLLLRNVAYTEYRIESKFEYRPDLISHKFYNNPELWWVIFEYNEFQHPFNDFYTDRQIKIPRYDAFIAYLI